MLIELKFFPSHAETSRAAARALKHAPAQIVARTVNVSGIS